jgi:uncharacterized membrane protein (DUF4010 family)
MPDTTVLFERLAVALAIGLLIGLERGWKTRELLEGQRVAGVRTFGVIGLLGGLSAVLTLLTNALTLGAALLGMTALLGLNHWYTLHRGEDIGSTTIIAAQATFALGALAGFGELTVAASAAVVLTLLLGVKTQLHGIVARLEERELMAVLQLLIISVVLLPVLPDQGYGPYGALNPYRIWWMVVLIAGLSFLGYIAIKTVGARRGVLLTGFMGGLASSTVTAINLARLARNSKEAAASPLLAAGAVGAVATMFPRVLVIVAVVAPDLLPALAWPLGLATVTALAATAWRWRHGEALSEPGALQPRNPFELRMALQFAALLTVVMLLARALKAWAGDTGLYVLAGISGLTDVDAITLSLAAMVGDQETTASVATLGIVLAAVANTLVKPILVTVVGARRMALHMLWPLLLSMAAAGVGVYIARMTAGQ